MDQAAPNAGSKTAHCCPLFKREDIDGLDIDRFQVCIALRDRHLRTQAGEARLNAYALEWDLDVTRRHQATVQCFVHDSDSFQKNAKRSAVQGSAVPPR